MSTTSRRSFLKALGLGGATAALGTGFAPAVTRTAETAVARVAGGDTTGLLQLARVWPTRRTAHIIGEFDDTHVVFDDGSVELLLWPGDEERLRASNLRFEITERDVIGRDAALFRDGSGTRPAGLLPQPGETADGTYRDLDQFNADMQLLADTYPGLCELFEMPETSLQGRTVYGLEIAEDVSRRDGRPVFYNDGIHHAREWPAAEVPIMWAFDLLEAYARVEADEAGQGETESSELDDRRLHHLVKHTRNIVVPVVNVDGYLYSRTGPAGTGRDVLDSSLTGINPLAGMQYWRKNMRAAVKELNTGMEAAIPQNGVLPTTPGAVGVDPNRNYSYRWGGDGSSAQMTSATYRGDVPFSEPEARNVKAIHEKYQCVAGITHHTSGNLVLWAWGDTHDDAPDDVLLARLGFAMGDYVKYRPTKSIDLYVTTGTCSDWMYGTFGSVSYTFEHAGSSFHPPYLEVVPQFYANNRRAFMLMAELICLEPEQRDLMKRALEDDLDTVHRNEHGTLRRHLFGSFSESLSGTEYSYSADDPLSVDGRYNCVLTGRLVDADGNGVKGTVRNTKSFDNPLVPGNPAGYETEPASWDSVIETGEDGTFRWTVYPTSAPAKEFAGTLEPVTITATTDGGIEVTRRVTLTRGQVLGLGDLVVA